MERKNGDEIDLVDVIVKVTRTILKNRVLILSLLIGGMVVGFLLAFAAPKVYKSKMLLTSQILTFSYAEKLVGTLQQLISERNDVILARKLNLTEKQASGIYEISLASGVDGGLGLPENAKNYLVITSRVKRQQVFDSLQAGLIHYFENNNYAKIRVRQRREYYLQIQREVNAELKSLEEFKQNIYSGQFIEKTKGNIMFDPTIVNSKIIDLKKDLIEYKNALELVNSIEVVEGFTPFNKPVGARKVIATLVGGVIGVLLAFAIIGVDALRHALKRSEHTS